MARTAPRIFSTIEGTRNLNPVTVAHENLGCRLCHLTHDKHRVNNLNLPKNFFCLEHLIITRIIDDLYQIGCMTWDTLSNMGANILLKTPDMGDTNLDGC